MRPLLICGRVIAVGQDSADGMLLTSPTVVIFWTACQSGSESGGGYSAWQIVGVGQGRAGIRWGHGCPATDVASAERRKWDR
jgi:hypothetical protein